MEGCVGVMKEVNTLDAITNLPPSGIKRSGAATLPKIMQDKLNQHTINSAAYA
jgi:hypothetical protein